MLTDGVEGIQRILYLTEGVAEVVDKDPFLNDGIEKPW